MSRWIDLFANHQFQTTWASLKTQVLSETADDETIVTTVNELARLQKVIIYLDELINAIDPELVPVSIWDNFNSQATACLQQVNQYNSNRNVGHLQNANNHADNLLSYIRPYMVPSKSLGNALHQAIKKYAQTIEEYEESFRTKSSVLVEEIREYSEKSKNLHNDIASTFDSIELLSHKLFGDESEEGIDKRVDELVEDFQSKYEEINGFYNETLIGDEDEASTKKQISQAKEAFFADSAAIKDALSEVTSEIDDLTEFHEKIFGKKTDDDEEDGGLSGELNERIKALDDFEEKQVIKYNALNEQIESLLPGATSAGLASAYREMKISFDDPIKNASTVFYLAIGLLVIASALLAIDSAGLYYINFVSFNDWNTVLKGLAYKIPFYAPILWLAFYASKRRSEYQRLQQEYAHKEALAKSYDSYKKQLEELDNEDLEMQKIFMMKAIDAVAYNASATLDGKHGDKLPSQDIIEKFLDDLSKVKNLFKD